MSRACSQNGRRWDVFNILRGKPAGKDLLEGLGIDGRTILEHIKK
jgi:hypothetical protein